MASINELGLQKYPVKKRLGIDVNEEKRYAYMKGMIDTLNNLTETLMNPEPKSLKEFAERVKSFVDTYYHVY